MPRRGNSRKSRERRPSDDAYNARRRLKRQAARLEREAAGASGAYASKLRMLANEALEKAEQTYYNRESRSYDVQALREAESMGKRLYEADEDIQADILLSSPIGSRIYAGTVEIWRGIEDYNEREEAILKAFGVKRMADVLKILERQLGEALYSVESDEAYTQISLLIMQMVGSTQ